ncbi:hypothetical protein [Acinetobacter sp. ANC 4648]|uniref:hypothetical protein n=1 Tax=Acinetobacter sp. ANC 4648 TaxID=1977875 RepID=UPI00148AB4D7|nr:hypothetical protein [Acinetobacter sp. ANC 4648]
MTQNKPNKFIAPIVIAGITVGFLASAYKFIVSKPKSQDKQQITQTEEYPTQDQ